MEGFAIYSIWLYISYERDIWQHKTAVEVHEVWAKPMAALWWFEISCSLPRPLGWIQEVLLFSLWMGQQSQGIPFCHESLATTKVVGARKKKSPTSTPCWLSENFVTTLTHKVWTNEKLCKSSGQNKSKFQVSIWKVFKT